MIKIMVTNPIYEVRTSESFFEVSYQPYGPLECVAWIKHDVPNSLRYAELICAALNTIEAAKQQPTAKFLDEQRACV